METIHSVAMTPHPLAGEPRTLRVQFPWRKTVISSHKRAWRSHRVQSGPGRPTGSSSVAEGRGDDPQCRDDTALYSKQAQRLAGFPSVDVYLFTCSS